MKKPAMKKPAPINIRPLRSETADAERQAFVAGRTIVKLKLSELLLDPRVQPREELDDETLQNYASEIKQMLDDGRDPCEEFPPLVAFVDEAGTKRVADGAHRTVSARRAGLQEWLVDLRPGDADAAYLYAVSANRKHGLRFSNRDKRKIARRFLTDPKWAGWSDSEISRQAGCSRPLVASVRAEVQAKPQPAAAAGSTHAQHAAVAGSEHTSSSGATLGQPAAAAGSTKTEAPLIERRRGADGKVRRLPIRESSRTQALPLFDWNSLGKKWALEHRTSELGRPAIKQALEAEYDQFLSCAAWGASFAGNPSSVRQTAVRLLLLGADAIRKES